MVVRFDKLNRFEIPKMYLCSPGSRIQNGIISGVAGILTDTKDEELVLNFNAVSELNFRLYRTKRDDPDDTEYVYRLFKTTQNRRMIYLDDIGFFIITEVVDGYDGNNQYKDVRAQSCEIEIQNKNIPFIDDGTYQFDDLLEMIVDTIPGWTIGTVAASVSELYRTFEDVSDDLNCLGFMMENMQDAYECIFIFDCTNRVINVYDQNNYVETTSIHITKEDLINSIDITENSDDLYTVISVTGDENLNIAAVNPLGTGQIYNFDYYIPWMSDALQARVNAWKADVAAAEEDYTEDNRSYYELLQQQSDLNAQLQQLSTQIAMYKRCRDNIVAESDMSDVGAYDPEEESPPSGSYNEVIVANGGAPITVYEDDIEQTLSEIDDLIRAAETEATEVSGDLETVADSIAALIAEISTTQSTLEITNYFTDDGDTSLLDELTNYMFEGSYTDEYIGITSIMDYGEIFEQMQTLYRRAIAQLERISQPRQEFSIDVENFIFAKDFVEFSEQLRVGALINVELDQDDVAQLFLTCITVNYEDGTLSLTFGNRFDKFDPKSLFDDALGSIQKSANTLNYMKEILYPIKNGDINHMKELLENSRTLTKDMALSATDEEVLIDDTGYTGRKILSTGEYDRRQVKLTHNVLVFTDDNWDTSKVAIGEIIMPGTNGTTETVYGINGNYIVGDIIVGNALHIVDNDGNDMMTVVDGRISTHVEEAINETVYGEDGTGGLNKRITDVEQTANGLEIKVGEFTYVDGDGHTQVSSVKTVTGYTFGAGGLMINQEGNEITNLITNNGMYVNRGDDNVLTVNNEGVDALNLKTRKFLIIGDRARFEPYGNNRTGCFYIGN